MIIRYLKMKRNLTRKYSAAITSEMSVGGLITAVLLLTHNYICFNDQQGGILCAICLGHNCWVFSSNFN